MQPCAGFHNSANVGLHTHVHTLLTQVATSSPVLSDTVTAQFLSLATSSPVMSDTDAAPCLPVVTSSPVLMLPQRSL